MGLVICIVASGYRYRQTDGERPPSRLGQAEPSLPSEPIVVGRPDRPHAPEAGSSRRAGALGFTRCPIYGSSFWTCALIHSPRAVAIPSGSAWKSRRAIDITIPGSAEILHPLGTSLGRSFGNGGFP